ncbi:hypothetical protein E4U12_008030 [Claviceps purpurea]|nr:hypothetical protein E4U12_008030 [Claviceps purpurea]
MLHPRRRHNRLQSGTESDVFHLRMISYAPDSPSTTTNASATSKALKGLEVHGDVREAGTQIPRASQRMAPLLEDPEAPFTLRDPGAIKWTGEEDAE